MKKPGWGVVVQGEPADLEDWAYTLKEPFDPWVQIDGDQTVLRSALFDELTSATDVRDRAIAYIDRLNGAIALSQGARPLYFGGVVEFTPAGLQHRTIFAEMVTAEARSKARAVATVIGLDGKPVSSPPQPSEVQSWAATADDDDFLDDALIYFGRATNWFDIYKTLECLILRHGGSEAAFLALGWASEAEITRLKRTANWARHARRKFDPPKNPMPLRDAHALLGQLLRRALH